MSEALQSLLRLIDHEKSPVLDADFVERWPDGELERCLAAGLLQPASPARYLACRCCGEIEEVIVLEDPLSRQRHAYTPCGEGGPVPVPFARLRRWQLHAQQFLDAVFAQVSLIGDRRELVHDHVWRLGKAKWAGAVRDVYFARGLHRPDAVGVFTEVNPTTRSLLFVPTCLPRQNSATPTPTTIRLCEAISWQDTAIRLDHDYIDARLAEVLLALPNHADKKQPAPKRGSRTALIEALTRELQEHLRAARDHARATQDRSGTPELLARPTMELLARQLRVHKSTISRCFEDASARELRFLWDLAADLDRILSHTCHA